MQPAKCSLEIPRADRAGKTSRVSQRRTRFVGEERRRIGDDFDNIRFDLFVIEPTSKHAAHVFARQLQGIALRHAEADEVLVVHKMWFVLKKWERSVRTHFECAAVFVLFVVVKDRRWSRTKPCNE